LQSIPESEVRFFSATWVVLNVAILTLFVACFCSGSMRWRSIWRLCRSFW
jgi:hypothetical protein